MEATMPEFMITEARESPYLYVEKTSSMAPDQVGQAMGEAFGAVWGFMQAHGVAPAGGALSVYYDYDMSQMAFRAGFAVAREDLDKAEGEVKGDVTPAGRVVRFIHEGPYETVGADYDLMMAWLEGQGLKMGVPAWEVYLNDPDQVPPEDLRTECNVVLA